MRTALSIVMGLALALVAPSALAQDTTGTGTAGGTVGGTTDASAQVTAPKVQTAPKAEVKEEDGVTDHEKVVGRFAIGYLGLTNLPLGGGAALGVTRNTVPAPIIGGRYWLNKMIGIDAGLGFALQSSSGDVEAANTTTTTDGPSIFGLALHGGVPLALATGKHYTFQVVPELNVGFTSQTDKQTGAAPQPDIKHSGFRLDLGARAGTEIHFGFIGVPELALQASVGLYLQYQAWKNSQDQGGVSGPPTPQSSSIKQTSISTTVFSDPWALFVNNISALYYF